MLKWVLKLFDFLASDRNPFLRRDFNRVQYFSTYISVKGGKAYVGFLTLYNEFAKLKSTYCLDDCRIHKIQNDWFFDVCDSYLAQDLVVYGILGQCISGGK